MGAVEKMSGCVGAKQLEYSGFVLGLVVVSTSDRNRMTGAGSKRDRGREGRAG